MTGLLRSNRLFPMGNPFWGGSMKNLAFSCTIPGPDLRIRYSDRIFLGGSFDILAFFPDLGNLGGSTPGIPRAMVDGPI